MDTWQKRKTFFTEHLSVADSIFIQFYFTVRCQSKNGVRKPEEELQKKLSNLKNSKTSGTSREAVKKVENELKPFKFFTRLDHFVLPRNSKSQFDQNDKEEHSQPVGRLDDQTSQECESHKWPDALDLDDDLTTERYLDEGRSSRVVSTHEKFPENVAASVCKKQKSSQKRKLLISSSDKQEQEKMLLLRSIKEKMETRAKKKEMDAADRFVASIADELRELPHRKMLLAKNEIKNILFRYQIQGLEKGSNSNNNNNAKILFPCFNKEIKWYTYQEPSIQHV